METHDETIDHCWLFSSYTPRLLVGVIYLLIAPIFGLEVEGFEPPRSRTSSGIDRMVEHYSHMPFYTRMAIGIPAAIIGAASLIATGALFCGYIFVNQNKDPFESPIYPYVFFSGLLLGLICEGEFNARERALNRRDWMFPEQATITA